MMRSIALIYSYTRYGIGLYSEEFAFNILSNRFYKQLNIKFKSGSKFIPNII